MDAPSTLTFADLLRYHRLAARLTQEELAEQARLSVDAISTLERGARRRPRKETVTLLADALALSPDDRAALFDAARRSPDGLAAIPREAAAVDDDGRAPASTGDLPQGAVTLLIAAIEGSDGVIEQPGEQYAEALATVHEILRSVWPTHHGHELGAQGDHFFVVFAHPDDAVAAAVAAQQTMATHAWPEGAPVWLRIGIHTGVAQMTAGRYIGVEVHRALHIAAAGHAGQALVSQVTVAEIAKRGQAFPSGVSLKNLGVHRLSGLRQREAIFQLILPGVPGLPSQFPPLRTLDRWPIVRARLLVGGWLTLALLALIGLLLPDAVPTFPRALGVVAGLGALALGAGIALARMKQPSPLRHLARELRQPVVTLTSALLSLVVALTLLFATTPRQLIAPHQNSGYDFGYTYRQPTHIGGSITIGTETPILTLIPQFLSGYQLPDEVYHAVWNTCVAQLPDLTLPGLDGWKADQCSEVPTVANGEEDPSGKWTIFRIDPHAVWSDGRPITADDFLFTFRMATDPNVQAAVWPCECPTIIPPWSLMSLTKLDMRTVRIGWSIPYGDYLAALAQLIPLPLHVYASGPFARIYDPTTDTYNSALARQMAAEDNFNLHIPVDNGPFIVRRVEGYTLPTYQSNTFSTARRLVLTRNPHFFSRFFHTPALDQVTFETLWSPAGPDPTIGAKLITAYRQSGLTVADGLQPIDLTHLTGIPKGEVITNPVPELITLGFNQRSVAPNARANGGVSIFADIAVRKAFVEAFDRCGALKAVLGLRDCNDPNYHTDEPTARPSVDYDASVSLPAYNPTDAARLLDLAGFPVVDGVRRSKDGTTPLRLFVSLSFGATPYVDMARRLQQDYARNLHIAVQIENPPGQLLGDTGFLGAFDIGICRCGPDSPDPVANLVATWGFDAASIPSAQNPNGINLLGLIDPWVVAQDRLGRQTVDGGQRATVYKGMARHVTGQFDLLPLLIIADVALVRPTLCNVKKWPEFSFYLWNMADWYVAPKCP